METKAARELAVPRQLDELQASIDSLGKELELLFERLGRVLSSERPQTNKDVPPVQNMSTCDLSDNIAAKAYQIHTMRENVTLVVERLEV